MKGDFSRVTFDPRNHFSQVLLQQGRVTLDADPNEQGMILLHYLRTLSRDLFGPHGGPVDNLGFELTLDVTPSPATLVIGAGRYYVDGILCESAGCDYIDQPHYVPLRADDKNDGDALRTWLSDRSEGDGQFWIYLDVWERHVSAIEHPSIREVALGGPDTCSRAQVVWQVRSLERSDLEADLNHRAEAVQKRIDKTNDAVELARLKALLTRIREGIDRLRENPTDACDVPLLVLDRDEWPELAARIDPGHRLDDPCITRPESGYRGTENHLYRVEIHSGNGNGGRATFKWSRDNGSVAARWLGAAGDSLTIGSTRGFAAGQWIELCNDEDDLLNRAGPLLRIASVEGDQLTVDGAPAWINGASNPKVRRWDQTENEDIALISGGVPVIESSATDPGWIDLEDGIQIRFAPGGVYRSGDYWLIPARVATGNIEWPINDDDQAALKHPRGIAHHYAPLGFIGTKADGQIQTHSCRCVVYPMSTCGVFSSRLGNAGTDATPVIPPAPAPAPRPRRPSRPRPVDR